MTRVLHFFEPATHGVPNFVAFLAQHQAESSHDVTVLGPRPREIPGVAWEAAEVQRSSPRSILRSGRRAAGLAAEVDADVIHAHSFFAALAIRLVNPDRPVVYTPHAWAFAMSGPSRYPAVALERALLGRTTRILCVSSGAAQHGRDVLGNDIPFVSIGSAIDLDRFSTDEAATTAPAGTIGAADMDAYGAFAVCVGRISHQKGQLALAQHWAEEMSDHPLQLVFVGDGHPDALDSASYPLSDGNVHFVGPSPHVAEWLRASAFAVQPSRWEAMSLATAEALACGRAVVATDVAGMGEAIVDGPLPPAGVVVRSIDQIAAASRSLHDQPRRLDDVSAVARRRAEELFSPAGLVTRTEHEYTLAQGIIDLVPPSPVQPDTVPLDLPADAAIELRASHDNATRTRAVDLGSHPDDSPEVAA